MKRSWLQRKKTVPLKRTPIRFKGVSESSVLKDEIQFLLREVVMRRDGGCILRKYRFCGGELGECVIQADHLITRSNSATYADSRLVVCVCKDCHGWKHWHKEEYDALVRTILPPDRVELWRRCEEDSWRPTPKGKYDWKLHILQLKQELKSYG